MTLAKQILRCAIYTRKSTEEGLDQEFNSLDAQRDSCAAYVQSQALEGWMILEDRYDDGGFSGGNTDRPALRRLLADVEAGKIDVVVVYKVDRLSRSLVDFVRIADIFERHHVAFVSVTQLFNTANSMGRLMLNVLLSFAQFEREIISERTRDKMAAARRRGQWLGGTPILGYDVEGTKLVRNETEASIVRQIFELYLDKSGLILAVQELSRRDWKNKVWTTRSGKIRGGKPFTKTSLHRLLTNPTYLGKVQYKNELFDGRHDAIVDPKLWDATQSLLAQNGRTGGTAVRNKFGALLKGILRCSSCGCAMSPTHSTKGGTKRYRYYRCQNAHKSGQGACPHPTVPAHEIERVVLEQIRQIGRDPELIAQTLAQAQRQTAIRQTDLQSEQRRLERERSQLNSETRRLLRDGSMTNTESASAALLAELQERECSLEQRLGEIAEELEVLHRKSVEPGDCVQILRQFDPVWNALTLREQVRLLQLLIERVEFDGLAGKVSITFHPTVLTALPTVPETVA